MQTQTKDLNTIKLQCLDEIMHLTDFELISKIMDIIKTTKQTSALDPYEISPSDDPFWSDANNVAKLNHALAEARNPENKIVATLKSKEDIDEFINTL